MPLILKHTKPLLGIWKMDETETELLDMLDGNAEEYVARLAEVKAKRRRMEWLASRALLKTLTGVEFRVAYHIDGAPYLPGTSTAISISHTTGYAAVLLTQHDVAGIDIERRSPRVLKVRSRFLSPEEDAAVEGKDAVSRALVYWCAKEAVFKAMRETDVDFASHIFIEPFDIALEGEILARETRSAEKRTYRLRYEVGREFVLVYTVGDKE